MLILTSAAFSSDPPPLQQSLEKTTYFSIGMNGFIGYQSEGEKLYTYILTLDNPEEIFKNIIKNMIILNTVNLGHSFQSKISLD